MKQVRHAKKRTSGKKKAGEDLTALLERKKIEVALGNVAKEWQTTFDSVGDAVWILDKEHLIIRANKQTKNVLGVMPEQIIGKHCWEVVHGTSEPIPECPYSKMEKSARRERMELSSGGRFFEVTVDPILDESGSLRGAVHIVRDITKIKQEEIQYRTILRTAIDGFWIADIQGHLLEVNDAYCSMIGYSRDELLKMSVRDVEVIERPEETAARIKKIMETGGDRFETKHRRKDNSIIDVEVSVNYIKAEGGRMVVFLHNISGRKKTEAALYEGNVALESSLKQLEETQTQLIQQERLRALGQMASGIAHDFNNALSPILGFTEMILEISPEKMPPQKLIEYLEMIKTSALDAAETVKRLREFYRYRDEGEVFSPVNIRELVAQAVKLTEPRWRGMAQARGVDIDVRIEDEVVPAVLGNESELREVLTNLIFNAVDAMEESGRITIKMRSVTCEMKESLGVRNLDCKAIHDRCVLIEINDTGAGMTEEVRKKCLDPFFTTKQEKGTGLGLSMVHGIIKRHGGCMDIESEAGCGTTVRIFIPVREDAQKETHEPSAADSVFTRLRVLVVEDEEKVRMLIEEYVCALGHDVETAANGKDALRWIESGEFDIVLTDRSMPFMRGDEVAKTVKKKSPRTGVILLTGFGDMMQAAGETVEGVDAILAKPVTLDELRDAIRSVVVNIRD